MKTLLTLAIISLSISAYAQNTTYFPVGMADCEGFGAGVDYTFDGQGSTMIGEADITIHHFGGPAVDTLSTANQVLSTYIPLPPSHLDTFNVAESHRISAHYDYFEFMFMDTASMVVNDFPSEIPMECGIVLSCHGSVIKTTGGNAVFIVGGNFAGTTDSITISEPDSVVAIPLALYNGVIWDGWTSDVVYVSDPIWVIGQTTPTCMDGPTGTATVMTDGVNGPYTYTWAGRTDTTATIVDLAAGFYNVTVTDAEGCSMSDDMEVLLDTCLITQVNEEVLAKLEVWPNPTSGSLNFSVEEYEEFYVMNPAGQVVMQGRIGGIGYIDVSALASGAYVIRLSDNTHLATARFVIER